MKEKNSNKIELQREKKIKVKEKKEKERKKKGIRPNLLNKGHAQKKRLKKRNDTAQMDT